MIIGTTWFSHNPAARGLIELHDAYRAAVLRNKDIYAQLDTEARTMHGYGQYDILPTETTMEILRNPDLVAAEDDVRKRNKAYHDGVMAIAPIGITECDIEALDFTLARESGRETIIREIEAYERGEVTEIDTDTNDIADEVQSGDTDSGTGSADGNSGNSIPTNSGNNTTSNTSSGTADIIDFFENAIEAQASMIRNNGGNWPRLEELTGSIAKQLKRDILSEVQLSVDLENSIRSKSAKLTVPRSLSPEAAAQIILRTGDVRAMVMSDTIIDHDHAYDDGERKIYGVRVLAYYHHTGANAGIWQLDSGDKSCQRIREVAAALGVSAKEVPFVVSRVMDTAKTIDEDDYHGVALLRNGVLDLATKGFTPYVTDDGKENPAYIIRYGHRNFFWKCRTNWNPDADDVLLIGPDGYEWSVERHFEQVLGDNPVAAEAIWQAFGFAIRGISGGRMLALVDATGNAGGGGGKSTTIDLLLYAVGAENVFSKDLDKATAKFGLAGLLGKHVIIGHENNGTIEDAGTFKALVTGDPVLVERKGQDAIPYRFKGQIISSMQRGLSAKEKSGAFYRRQLIVPFGVRMTKDADRRYIQEDAEENGIAFVRRREVREYVVKKALTMYTGDRFSKEVIDGLAEYTRAVRESTSTVYKFMEEVAPTIQSPKFPFDALYTAYRRWCQQRGYNNPCNEDTFLIDFHSWSADNDGTLRYTSGDVQRFKKTWAAPEEFLGLYGDMIWRANPNLTITSLEEGGRWHPDKVGSPQRRWIERVESTGEVATTIRDTTRTPEQIEDDYRTFVGAWCYIHATDLAVGRVTLNDLPDYEEWEALGNPRATYIPTMKEYAKTGFSINGWESYSRQIRYSLDFQPWSGDQIITDKTVR